MDGTEQVQQGCMGRFHTMIDTRMTCCDQCGESWRHEPKPADQAEEKCGICEEPVTNPLYSPEGMPYHRGYCDEPAARRAEKVHAETVDRIARAIVKAAGLEWSRIAEELKLHFRREAREVLEVQHHTIASLQSEIDRLFDLSNESWRTSRKRDDLIAELRARNTELLSALKAYAEHEEGCAVWKQETCTCGLAAIIAGATTPLPDGEESAASV